MRPGSPCKECRKRHEACHASCEAYREYKTEPEIYEKARRAESWGEFADYVYVQQQKGRGIRRRRK